MSSTLKIWIINSWQSMRGRNAMSPTHNVISNTKPQGRRFFFPEIWQWNVWYIQFRKSHKDRTHRLVGREKYLIHKIRLVYKKLASFLKCFHPFTFNIWPMSLSCDFRKNLVFSTIHHNFWQSVYHVCQNLSKVSLSGLFQTFSTYITVWGALGMQLSLLSNLELSVVQGYFYSRKRALTLEVHFTKTQNGDVH